MLQFAIHIAIIFRFYTQSHHHYDCQSSCTAWPLKRGPICCLETSVWNYYSAVCKISEQRRSHLHCSWSKKSCTHFKNSQLGCGCTLFISSSSCYHRYIFNKLHMYVLSMYFIIHKLFIALFGTPSILFAAEFLPSLISLKSKFCGLFYFLWVCY